MKADIETDYEEVGFEPIDTGNADYLASVFATVETSGDTSKEYLQLEKPTFKDMQRTGHIGANEKFEDYVSIKDGKRSQADTGKYKQITRKFYDYMVDTWGVENPEEAALFAFRPAYKKRYGSVENIPEDLKGSFGKTAKKVMTQRKNHLIDAGYLEFDPEPEGINALSKLNPFAATEASADTINEFEDLGFEPENAGDYSDLGFEPEPQKKDVDVLGILGKNLMNAPQGMVDTIIKDAKALYAVNKGFEEGVSFGIGGDEQVQADNPIAYFAGQAAGGITSLVGTGAVIGASAVGAGAAELANAARAVKGLGQFAPRFLPRMIVSGASFGTHTAISETVSQIKEGRADPIDFGGKVLKDTAMGGALGLVGGVANAPMAALMGGGIFYSSAKMDGADEPEAILSGAMGMGFEIFGSVGRNKQLRTQVLKVTKRTLADYAQKKNPKMPRGEAELISEKFMNQKAAGVGGWDKVLETPENGIRYLEKLNANILKRTSQLKPDVKTATEAPKLLTFQDMVENPQTAMKPEAPVASTEARTPEQSKMGQEAPESATEVKSAQPESKQEQDLEVEAKKYKSAEEFISSKDVVDGAYVSYSISNDTEFDNNGNEVVGDDYVLIDKVFVPKDKRQKGFGKAIIKNALTDIMTNEETKGLPIKLAADPFDGGMEQDELVEFYERLGFESNAVDGMSGVVMEYNDNIPGYSGVFTKQQLTDIWNKANQKETLAETEARKAEIERAKNIMPLLETVPGGLLGEPGEQNRKRAPDKSFVWPALQNKGYTQAGLTKIFQKVLDGKPLAPVQKQVYNEIVKEYDYLDEITKKEIDDSDDAVITLRQMNPEISDNDIKDILTEIDKEELWDDERTQRAVEDYLKKKKKGAEGTGENVPERESKITPSGQIRPELQAPIPGELFQENGELFDGVEEAPAKYGKGLMEEAKKYKSAEEFVEAKKDVSKNILFPIASKLSKEAAKELMSIGKKYNDDVVIEGKDIVLDDETVMRVNKTTEDYITKEYTSPQDIDNRVQQKKEYLFDLILNGIAPNRLSINDIAERYDAQAVGSDIREHINIDIAKRLSDFLMTDSAEKEFLAYANASISEENRKILDATARINQPQQGWFFSDPKSAIEKSTQRKEFIENIIANKQQLTDIWNKANQKQGVEERKSDYEYPTVQDSGGNAGMPGRTGAATGVQSPISVKFKETGKVVFPAGKIKTPEDVAFAFRSLTNEAQENFLILAVKDGEQVAVEHITTGTHNFAAPAVYEFFNLIDFSQADTVYLVHNHPSGKVGPSPQDRTFTRKAKQILEKAGIKMGGHVIIDTEKFLFINEFGEDEAFYHKEYAETKEVPQLKKYFEWSKSKDDFGPKISDSKDVYEVAKGLQQSPDMSTVVIANQDMKVLSVNPIPATQINSGNIARIATRARGNVVFVVGRDVKLNEASGLKEELGIANIALYDMIDVSPDNTNMFKSAADTGVMEPGGAYESGGVAEPEFDSKDIEKYRKGVEDLLSAKKAQASVRKEEPPQAPKELVKPILNQSQLKRKAREEANKLKREQIEEAPEIMSRVQADIRQRSAEISLGIYESNQFINAIKQVTSKEQREVLPFIIENTPVPKELGRPDLEAVYAKDFEYLKPLARQVKDHFDKGWKFMQANIENMSAQQIEDYVTHIWQRGKKKKSEITNAVITKNRFLKQRFIETYYKGIVELGLKPKTLDVADIILTHDSIMVKTIANEKFIKDLMNLKKDGVTMIERSDKAPVDWVYFDHPALRKMMIISGEGKMMNRVSDELVSIFNEMGLAIGRRLSPTVFGKPNRKAGHFKDGAPPEIALQKFFSTETLAHEIGHFIDSKLGLGKYFVDSFKTELYALNRERIEELSKNKGAFGGFPSWKAYAESPEEQIAELFAALFANPDKAYKIAPNATNYVVDKIKQDGALEKLVDFDFETKSKLLLEKQADTMLKVAVKVHPDLEKPLRVIFDSRMRNPLITAYETVNGLLKKTWLSISLFHHGALFETGVATMGPVKTAKLAFNLKKIYEALAKNKFDVYKNSDLAKDAIRHGLQLGVTSDIPVQKIQRWLDELRVKTKNTPVAKHVSAFIASFNEAWDKALWDYYHDGLKLYGYEHLVSKYLDPSGDIAQQKQEIAAMVNDTFGGQNWDNLMVSPKTLQIMSWVLLSPDWTTSTVRQALSPTGVGTIHNKMRGLRRKIGAMFWIKAFMYFGVGINFLNAAFRARDRREHPEYYTDEESFMGNTMFGNVIGHKTHLFLGRYKSGQERYGRWGKQFRELPELFIDDTGFSPITAAQKKIGGKAAPALQTAVTIFTDKSLSGFENRDLSQAKGWEKAYEQFKYLAKLPFPFSVRSMMDPDKEFFITDIAIPSSKGMSRWKATELFRVAIERKDERLFTEVWQDAIQNNLPAETLYKSALSTLRAQGTRERNSQIKSISDIDEMLKGETDPRVIKSLNRKKRTLRKDIEQVRMGTKMLQRSIEQMKNE